MNRLDRAALDDHGERRAALVAEAWRLSGSLAVDQTSCTMGIELDHPIATTWTVTLGSWPPPPGSSSRCWSNTPRNGRRAPFSDRGKPLFGLMLAMTPLPLALVAATLAAGTPALTMIGAIGAALTVSPRRGGLLMAVLARPLSIPVLISASRAPRPQAAAPRRS
jgi:CcmB protein